MKKIKYYRLRATGLVFAALLFLVTGYFNLKTGRLAEGMITLATGVILMGFFSALLVIKRIGDTADDQSE
jgi:hypothetical protein